MMKGRTDRSVSPGGDHGDLGGHEHEADTGPHVPGDFLAKDQHGQDGRQHGLEEEDQRALHGGGGFHAHEVAGIAARGDENADIEHVEEVARGIAAEEGHGGEHGQTGGLQGIGHGGDVADEHEDDHLGAGGQAAEAGDGHAGVLGALLFAQHGIKGEGGGREQHQRDAHGIERGVQRIDDDEGGRHFHDQGGDVLGPDVGAQDEIGEGQHQHGVAAEQHADHRGRGVKDGHLVEHHAHHQAHEAEPGKAFPCGGGDPCPVLAQAAQGKGDEQQATHEEAGAVELHGVEIMGHGLQGHFHGAEEHGGKKDENVSAVHRSRSLVGNLLLEKCCACL